MDSKKIMKYIVMAAVLLIPIMYSFFYLKAYWDPYGNLQDIKIAIVNLDEGKDNENQGKQFIETLIENGTFKICDVSEDQAKDGLVNGEYYAMITIPSTFTEDLKSAEDENKRIATITYSPNQKTNYLASQIINSAVKTIEINLQAKVAKTVTENLTEKLNEVPDSLEEIADSSEEILDGTEKLDDGAKELSNGANELNTSYAEFDVGVKSAYDGSTKLDQGVGTLQEGAETLINGVNSLQTGATSLDNGVSNLNDGAAQLSIGATSVYEGATSLAQGATNVLQGASSVSSGASELEGYLSELYKGIQATKSGYVSIDSGINEIITSLNKLKTAIDGLSSKKTELATLKASNEKAEATLKNKNTEIKSNYQKYFASYLNNKDLSKVTDAEINQIATTITTNYATALGAEQAKTIGTTYAALLKTWRDTYVGNLSLIELTEGNLSAVNTILGLLQSKDLQALVSEETSNKLTALKQGSSTMTVTLGKLEESTLKIYNGSKTLSTGANTLASGAKTLSTGASTLSAGTNTLKTGAKNLADGTNTLKTGSTELLSGVNKLANGGTQISLGIGNLKEGSSSLNSGLSLLSTSSTKVKLGISAIDTGALKLYNGTGTLKTGVTTFNREINSGLQDTKTELTKLKGLPEFTENPVEIKEEDYGKIEQYGLSFTPLFLSIGLWVGALMAYVVLYYDQDRRFKLLGKYADNKFLQIALYFAIAVLQGLITGILLKTGLGISPTSNGLYYFTCILVSTVFMSIIQFLIMNLGDIGKFLALVILVLQLAAAGGTFPIQTVAKVFQGLNPILPMTYSIRLVKEAVVSQDSGFAIKNIIILILYGIIPLAITIAVQIFKKQNKVEEN